MNLLFLSETHITEDYTTMMHFINFDNFHQVQAQSRWRGGLLLLWNNDIQLTVISSTHHFIHVSISLDNADWDVAFFYGEPNRAFRKDFWRYYTELLSHVTRPLLCCGDFNDLLQISDKYGGVQVHYRNTANLRFFTNSLGLQDLGFTGPAFTWANNQPFHTHVRERLDRAFATVDFITKYPDINVAHLPRFCSDHSPILVNLLPQVAKPKRYFMFENYWCKHPHFRSVITSAIHDAEIARSSHLPDKLLKITNGLRKWHGNTFKSIPKKITSIKQQLLQTQCAPISVESIQRECDLQFNLYKLMQIETDHWSQRAKLQMKADGDLYSKFFHAAVLKRKRSNTITRIVAPDGTVFSTQSDISRQFIDYFKLLFTNTSTSPVDTNIFPEANYFSAEELAELGPHSNF